MPPGANYGGCDRMQEARAVEKIRTHNRLSCRDAVATVRSQPSYSKSTLTLANKPLATSVSVAASQPPTVLHTRTVATQTNFVPSSDSTNPDVVKDFSILLIKVLQCLNVPNTDAQLATILTLIKDTVGVDISASAIAPGGSRAPHDNDAVSLPTPTFGSHAQSPATYNSHPGNKKQSHKTSLARNAKKSHTAVLSK